MKNGGLKCPLLIYKGETMKRFFSNGNITKNGSNIEQAVVHIFCQVAFFNWREPYKVRDQAENSGTGFFIDKDGSIITNAHVVDQARIVEIRVPALGYKALHASIISFCPERDFALLRIIPKDLERIKQNLGQISFLELGDSDAIARTEPILVLGYPLGQYNIKGSTGIVSGFESLEGASLIQITAPINPGNSGGPLINQKGEVVGIALAISAVSNTIGYAVPINNLKVILPALYKGGLVRSPSLGILYTVTTDDEAGFLHNPKPAGLYVNAVMKGSIADKMGMQAGDMIYQINGCQIDSFGQVKVPWNNDRVEFHDLINRIPFGSVITIDLYRAGDLIHYKSIFEVFDLYPIAQIFPDYQKVDYEVVAGLVIMQLTENHIHLLSEYAPWLINYFNLEYKSSPALVISHVVPGSQAYLRENLTAGQIIDQINGVQVVTLRELRETFGASSKIGFITVKTRQYVFAAFPVEKTVMEYQQLAEEFHFKESTLFLSKKTV